ncbi:MAG: hypothetical protein AUJ98_03770 [Bacteroidetes bacterium CG2_30_33_31]|nr:MAG: hypothetical protein AUJ98_03770 [Bacteroidetes bacterium CG2_30_33_31]
MQAIHTSTELKDAIKLLEVEHDLKGKLFREQMYLTYDSLKPVNIIKNTLKDISSSPIFIDNIIDNAIGLGTGFLTKKLIVGTSTNPFRNILGSIIQFGVTNIVAQHTQTIKSLGKYIFQIINKKEEEE